MFRFIKSQKGVAAVEFALTLLPFLTLVTVLIEVLFLIYQSVGVEYLNAQAGQYSSSFSYKDGYKKRYDEYLSDKKGNIGFFFKDDQAKINIKFCSSVEELVSDNCEGSNDDAKIIVYELDYLIKPIFLFNWLDKKKVIKSKVAYYAERGNPLATPKDKSKDKKAKK